MYKILIVDDEKIVRIALKTIINGDVNRFKIVGEARDGKGALEFIEKNDVHIIVTDLKMPNMDGIELIRNLSLIGYKGKILVMSNYDDYNLVREAMKLGASDYLLKLVIEEEEFLNSLKQIADELDKEFLKDKINSSNEKVSIDDLSKEEFLKNLVINTYDKEEIVKNIEALDVNLNEGKNIILFIFVDNMRKQALKERIKDKKMFEQSIINIVTDLLGNDYSGEAIGLEYRGFVLIVSVKEDIDKVEERINKLAHNISEMLEIYMNITVSIVMSQVCQRVEEIGEIVSQCRKAIEYKFYLGDKSIMRLEEVVFQDTILDQDYSSFIMTLKENLSLGQINKNIILFDDLFKKAKMSSCHPRDLKKIVSIMIENLASVVIKAGEKDILYMDENKGVLNNIETLEEYRGKLIALMNDMNERIEDINRSKYRKEVASIIKYIESNIEKKLNLTMIAEEINMNESYISRIFKDETGDTLIHFINRMKIEKAKELLKNNDVLSKEVATAVGIHDQFYFSRIFRKYVGMSPSQYKHKLHK